jgi:hypothetical protein
MSHKNYNIIVPQNSEYTLYQLTLMYQTGLIPDKKNVSRHKMLDLMCLHLEMNKEQQCIPFSHERVKSTTCTPLYPDVRA